MREIIDSFDVLEDEDTTMGTFTHSWIQMRCVLLLAQRLKPNFYGLPELTFDAAQKPYKPDVSVCPKRKPDVLHEPIRDPMPPLIAIEIVSPSEPARDIVLKVEEMLEAGVDTCWVIEPALETVTVYTRGKRYTYRCGETVEHPCLQAKVAVDEFFVD